MVVALVVDAEGRPICTEMVPGNSTDVKVLLPIVERLRARFGITRACVVADRGMISAHICAVLEERGLEYILGARERSSSVVRDIVLKDEAPMVPLLLDRQKGQTQLDTSKNLQWVPAACVAIETYTSQKRKKSGIIHLLSFDAS